MQKKKQVFVVISGKKKHGKNFFADKVKGLLVWENISFTETAFASPIKNFCADVFGIPMEDMETQEGKLKPTHLKWNDLEKSCWPDGLLMEKLNHYVTIRELLQIVGTEVFREGFYGPIWAEAPFRKKHTLTVSSTVVEFKQVITTDVVFITDCRFPNEIEEALKNDALLVRVVRDDIEDDNDEHISETALDDYEWAADEVVTASTDDGRLEKFAKEVLLPRIKGQLYGH